MELCKAEIICNWVLDMSGLDRLGMRVVGGVVLCA